MRKIKVVKRLTDKGYPVHDRHYETAHRAADKAEKRTYPQGYKKLRKLERKLKPHELMAKSTKKGEYEIEKKFSKEKNELLLHEKREHKKLNKLDSKTKKR